MKRSSIAMLLALLALGARTAFAEETEVIKIDLPEAMFDGTPNCTYGLEFAAEFPKRPQFNAPKGTHIISKGAAVSSSVPPTRGQLPQITDGDKDYGKKSVVELPSGLQWVQVDLGAEKSIRAIALWHWHEDKRVYVDVVAQASNDASFKDGVIVLYNNDRDNSASLGVGKDNEYFETNHGRLIETRGLKARYLRFYSKGNTANDNNTYIEVEVWGK